MSAWSADELDTLGTISEIDIAPRRADGTLWPFTTIWIVRVGDELYVRSYNGPDGSWYRAAKRSGQARIRAAGSEHDVRLEPAAATRDQIDAAYRTKYGQSTYVGTMTAHDTAATTLRIVARTSD